MTVDLLAAALAYADLKWPVFPLRPREKTPIYDGGFYIATCGREQIKMWWAEHPQANIGFPTGYKTLVVLDVDTRHAGDESLYGLEQKHGKFPETIEAITGGGGRHIYFTSQKPLRTKAGFEPGLDIRGEGAYVVLPPSLHPSGRRYAWEVEHRPGGIEPAPVPAWLVRKVETQSPQVANGLDKPIPAGQRNDMLARMAGAMRRWGMCEEAILAGLLVENERHCNPPLDENEVQLIVQSICRYQGKEARMSRVANVIQAGDA